MGAADGDGTNDGSATTEAASPGSSSVEPEASTTEPDSPGVDAETDAVEPAEVGAMDEQAVGTEDPGLASSDADASAPSEDATKVPGGTVAYVFLSSRVRRTQCRSAAREKGFSIRPIVRACPS